MRSAQHLLTRREAAAALGMSARTFDRVRERGEIDAAVEDGEPHKRGRRYLRFDRGAVLRWQREHRKSTDGQPEGQPSSERE